MNRGDSPIQDSPPNHDVLWMMSTFNLTSLLANFAIVLSLIPDILFVDTFLHSEDFLIWEEDFLEPASSKSLQQCFCTNYYKFFFFCSHHVDNKNVSQLNQQVITIGKRTTNTAIVLPQNASKIIVFWLVVTELTARLARYMQVATKKFKANFGEKYLQNLK